MHGRIISGIGYEDAVTTRMRAELQRLNMKSGGWTKSRAQQDLERDLIHRERMLQKRAALAQVANNPTDALDVLNAQAEAAAMAERMRRAGYTPAQIEAVTRPMIVNPAETITGRAKRQERRAKRQQRREERREAGKGVFRKIGAAVKKGAGFAFKGLAKVNPILAGARTAVLALVRQNAFGIADAMRASNVDRARSKWESVGGDFAKLQQAVEQGAGQRIAGYYDLPLDMQPSQVIGVAPVAAGAAAGGLAKLWMLAKPIIEKLLRALGVEAKGQLRQALDAPDSAETNAIRKQADDAEDPNTGEGPGSNSGAATMSPLLLAALGAGILIFATKKR